MSSGYLSTMMSPRRTSWYGSRYFAMQPAGAYDSLSTNRWSPTSRAPSMDPEGTTNACRTVVVPNRKMRIVTAQSAIQCRSGFGWVAMDQHERPAPARLLEEVLHQVHGMIDADRRAR